MTLFGGHGGSVTESHEDDPFILWDGAYVMGALASTERREYEAHLSGCGPCRTAVSELSGIAPLLALLDRDEALALDDDEDSADMAPRPELLDAVVSQVTRRRRRSRMVITAVAAIAAVLLAIGLTIVIRPETIGLQRQAPAPAELALDQVVETPLRATVALTGFAWGTHIDMTCVYGDYADRNDSNSELAMVVVGRDGSQIEAATWTAEGGTSATVDGSTSLPIEQIAAVQVVSATGQVLLQRNL